MATPGRKSRQTGVIEGEVAVDEAAIRQAANTLPQLAAQGSEVMHAIGYELPYERERIVQEAHFYMAASAEAMLEAGKRLILLKEFEPHGEFTDIVTERLGLSMRSAQVMMQAAAKYLMNPALASKAQTFALLGKAKLFELMAEPDDALECLAEGGTLAGHTMDEIDSMSVRELKTALREARDEAQAQAELLRNKNAKLDALQSKQRRIAPVKPDTVLDDLRRETTAIFNDARGALVGQLRQAFVCIRDHHDAHGGDSAIFLAGLAGQLQADLNALRDEFDLPDVSGAAIPEWMGELQQGGE